MSVLLVSHCNENGGLSIVDTGGRARHRGKVSPTKFYDVPTTGLCRAGGQIHAVTGDGQVLAVFPSTGKVERLFHLASRGHHDLEVNDGYFFTAAVCGNKVIKVNMSGFVADQFVLFPPTLNEDGEPDDNAHLNSIAFHDELMFFSHFSDTPVPRREKRLGLSWRRDSFIKTYDWTSSEISVVLHPLRQPHSLTMHDGCLWFTESFAGLVRRYDIRTRVAESLFETGEFCRGLAIDTGKGLMYIGLSRARNKATEVKRSSVLVIDMTSWSIVRKIEFQAPEIYDILVLD
jgi:hypothetical protein